VVVPRQLAISVLAEIAVVRASTSSVPGGGTSGSS
jgi:hypothetical protein